MEQSTKNNKRGRPAKGDSKKPTLALTVRLDAEQRKVFEAIAQERGLRSVSAAFKSQALRGNDAGALGELRAQMTFMSKSLADIEDRRRQDRFAVDALVQNVVEIGARQSSAIGEISALQSETLAMLTSLAESMKALADSL